MSLPSTKMYKDFNYNLKDSEYSSSINQRIDYDLNSFYSSLKQARLEQREKILTSFDESLTNPTTLLYELFSLPFLRSLSSNRQMIFNRYLGFSKKYQSLTISLLNDLDEVQTITIRRAFNKENEVVKWKSFGSKRYIHKNIKERDDFIFLVSGMAEIVLCELLEFSFIGLQSDSMHKFIDDTTIKEVSNKVIIVLSDNDATFKSILNPLKEVFVNSKVVVIDFEKMLNKDLPKGWDFRDTCNLIGSADEVIELLELEIIKGLKNV